MRQRRWPCVALAVAALAAGGCGSLGSNAKVERCGAECGGAGAEAPGWRLVRRTNSELKEGLPGCLLASPVETASGFVIVAGNEARAFDHSGHLLWQTLLPAPEGERGLAVATPVLVDDLLVVAYHTVADNGEAADVNTPRIRQLVVALDPKDGVLVEALPTLELSGSFDAVDGGTLEFLPEQALARAELVHGRRAGRDLVYVTFGNARDIQPWHGFAFEIDVGRWREQGAKSAVSATLVTTPESACGEDGASGSRSRICGGGLWAPSGPLLVQASDDFELILAPGNGQLDLERDDYANTLMRVGPGLDFDPDCDDACDDFNPDDPSLECSRSCRNLFIPRDEPGDPFPRPESGVCDDLSLFECWQLLDYVGGSTPALVELNDQRLLAYPAKDGALYLVDYDTLGLMHDRAQLVSICGTDTDPCRWDWAGMIVTQPVVTSVGQTPVVLVPTFMPDQTHPAGVVALDVTENSAGEARLRHRWEFPDFASDEAVSRFREHPGRIALHPERSDVAFVVETTRGGQGHLFALDTDDGSLLAEHELDGPGQRFTEPLVLDDTVYVPSCDSDAGPGRLEAFELVAP